MEDFDRHPELELRPRPQKGRGAAGNIDHRFTRTRRPAEDDGWDPPEPESLRTQLLVDSAKSIVSRNESPDLGFDQSINVYRGCEHGCVYCYARPTHAWLGLSPGLDFETRIFHKPQAAKLLRQELARPGYVCSPMALGTATDAYQPFERKLGLTRAILEVLLETGHPVSVVTKSALITRDLDLWRELARRHLAEVAISLTTLDSELSRRLEPRASAPAARLEALGKLAAVGIPVRAMAAPVIPGLNDQELERLLAAAADAGATGADYTLLRLPHEVATLFRDWLDWQAPEKAARIMAILYDLRGGQANDARFGSRMTGLGHFADLIRQRFALACRRLGLNRQWTALDCRQFTAPAPPAPAPARQLALF